MVSVGFSNSTLNNSSNINNNNNNTTYQNGTIPSAGLNSTNVPDPESVFSWARGVHFEEIIIVSIIVVFWVFAVMAFLRKWDSIRIMQPVEPRYKHNPKNLDSVKVVKRAQDSVIYKSYSRKMSVTMVAREKRIFQRMHTVPCLSLFPSVQTAIQSTKLPVQVEEMTTEM